MATRTSSSSCGEEEEEELALAVAPGFRFYPTEEELLGFYLRHRLASAAATRPQLHRVIPVVDVYAHHPSQLRSMAGEASVRDAEQWFFFCPRAPERELRGGRPARTTPSGYWKATGSPSYVFSSSSSELIGVKRTMVFYHGRAPTGAKTRWKMNEYKALAQHDSDDPVDAAHLQPTTAPPKLRNEFSVCRVYISTGTLRSFDRRPLNPPGGAGHGQAQAQAALYQHAPSSLAAAGTNLADDGAENTRDFGSSMIAAAAADSVNLDFDMDFQSTLATYLEFIE